MNYKIFDKDGNEVNRIFAGEDFVVRYCEVHGYTYEAEEPQPEPEAPAPVPTEMERLRADVDYIAMEMGVDL